MDERLHEISISRLQTMMQAGELTAESVTQAYIDAIAANDQAGIELHSVIELNPDACAIAAERDRERQAGRVRGALHGIPVLLKDNIDTADNMQTTAGSLALLGSKPTQDATVALRLREAGAIIIGKANLSEWANFRSTKSTGGWSARGGQCKNPYQLAHSPHGSSSGSGAAVAANFVAVALGTETDGSIVSPAGRCGIVGLKPTVGLTSRAGVIPIAHSQDTVGPMTRTVADAAIVLSALVGVDPRDAMTQASAGKLWTDYTQFLDPRGLQGARIGVARAGFFGADAETDRLIETMIDVLRAAGAHIVDPADIPTATDERMGPAESTVMQYEFKTDIAQYLATRIPQHEDYPQPRTLADLIAFNEAYAQEEMPLFGQERFLLAQAKGSLTDAVYVDALTTSQRLSRQEGIDAVLQAYELDALVAPTGGPACVVDYEQGDRPLGGSSRPAAMAGYPLLTVPAGFVRELPVGLTFMGSAYSEPLLIRLGYAFEQLTQARRVPRL